MSAVVRELTAAEARAVCCVLHAVEHITVDAHVVSSALAGCVVVNVWPVGRELTTREEVSALRAFAAVTDSPIRWYPVVDPR